MSQQSFTTNMTIGRQNVAIELHQIILKDGTSEFFGNAFIDSKLIVALKSTCSIIRATVSGEGMDRLTIGRQLHHPTDLMGVMAKTLTTCEALA